MFIMDISCNNVSIEQIVSFLYCMETISKILTTDTQ